MTRALTKDQIRKLHETVARLKAAHVVAARRSSAAFTSYVMRDESGQQLKLADFHHEWHKLLALHEQLIIWGSAEIGKTIQLISYVAWKIGMDPSIRVVIASKTKEKAAQILGAIVNVVSSAAYREVFPHVVIIGSNAHTLRVLGYDGKNPTVQAYQFKAPIVGNRVDLLIFDDILDRSNTRNEQTRDEWHQFYKDTYISRLTRRGQVVFISNAWHPRDLMHRLQEEGGWVTKRYPIWAEVNGKMVPLWPEQWPVERILKVREKFGKDRVFWDRNYECVALDDASVTWKREWVDEAERCGLGLPWPINLSAAHGETFRQIVIGVDLATKRPSSRRKTDESILCVVGQLHNGRKRLLHIRSGRWHGPEIVSEIREMRRRFHPAIPWVEQNACFPPQSLVLTFAGYKPIVDVREGDLVLTHKGRWRPVVKTASRQYDGDLTCVRPSGGLTLKATPNHEFYVRRAGRMPGKYNGFYRPQGEPQWLPCAQLSPPDSKNRLPCASRDTGYYVATPIQEVSPEPLHSVVIPYYDEAREVSIDEELGLLIGLYLAEGSCGFNQVRFALHEKEQSIRDYIKDVVKRRFDANSFETKQEGKCVAITVSSSILFKLLSPIGKSTGKCLPWAWMALPLPIRMAVVRGWLLGDGSRMTNNRAAKVSQKIIRGSSISRNLIYQMRATLLQAGLRPSLASVAGRESLIYGRKISGKPAYSLMLNADDSNVLFSLAINPIEREKWIGVLNIGTRASGSRIVLDGGRAWAKPQKVYTEPYSGLVYDLEVEEDHSFVVEDIAVHNSQIYIVDYCKEPGKQSQSSGWIGMEGLEDLLPQQSNEDPIPVRSFDTTAQNKYDSRFGVEALGTELSCGIWLFPNVPGVEQPAEYLKLIDEMMAYDPTGHVGDRLMAMWIANEGLRLGGGSIEVVPGANARGR